MSANTIIINLQIVLEFALFSEQENFYSMALKMQSCCNVSYLQHVFTQPLHSQHNNYYLSWRCVASVMVIIIGNGISEPSSNLG